MLSANTSRPKHGARCLTEKVPIVSLKPTAMSEMAEQTLATTASQVTASQQGELILSN